MKLSLVCAAVLAASTAGPSFAATYNPFPTLTGDAPKVIAHRGASGYLPEHTLGGYELAIQMSADIVEPDLQQTADGALVAMHDNSLARTTNVEALFAQRNGDYKVSDFTLAEIKTLTVEPTSSTASTTYPGFTPVSPDPYKVPTFGEVLALVNGHNAATGDRIGIYPEAKTPNSSAMNQQIIDEMKAGGFKDRDQLGYIQTFSHDGARELSTLQDLAGLDNAIAALGYAVFENGTYGVYDSTIQLTTTLTDLAAFADGVGVSLGSSGLDASFIGAAHLLGLEVHGWTFRPKTLDEARGLFGTWIAAGMDGFFTDYPDLGVAVVGESTAVVPLPATLPLLAFGLVGFAAIRRQSRV